MEICYGFRLKVTIVVLLIVCTAGQTTGQDVEKTSILDLPSTEASSEAIVKDDSNEGISQLEDSNESDEENDYENNAYDVLEETYDEFDDVQPKERKYFQALLIGTGLFLLLGLCGVIYKVRKGRNGCVSSWRGGDYAQRKRKHRSPGDSCVVNFMKPSPDLSDIVTDGHHMPLPLVYEDMGKICNNAEMFIQRCMTSSVKRTYSEPVKNIVSSRTKFRDYMKELAYLKDKESKECNKHGAVKHFFKDMLQVFKKTNQDDKRKRKRSSDIVGKSKQRDVYRSGRKKHHNTKIFKRESSSTSISISSLLLRPKYQSRYYKKEDETLYDNRTRHKASIKAKSPTKTISADQILSHRPKNIVDIRNLESNVDLENFSHIDTEELIKICVNTLRQPYNQKLLALFNNQNYEFLAEAQEVADAMTKEMAVQEYRKGDLTRKLAEAHQERLGPGQSQVLESRLLPNEGNNEVLEILAKQLLLLTTQNTRNNDNRTENNALVRAYPEVTKEEMIRKYLELQSEVDKFNNSLKEFAMNFVYCENEKEREEKNKVALRHKKKSEKKRGS